MKSKRGLSFIGASCFLIATLLFLNQPLAQAQQQFLAAPIYASGGSVKAVGDFNRDGKLDLVTVGGSNGISVLLGNGDGTFQRPVDLGAGALCCGDSAVVVGDFNGDGNLDIAVTAGGNPMCSGCADVVSVFLGNGDGTFRPRIDSLTEGFLSVSMAVGDFNGDGKLDLVTGSQAVSVLLGNGDGTFQPPVTYTTGGSPQAVAVGDFNGDGKADLAVVSIVNGGPNLLSIFLNKGDGTFLAPVNYTTAGSPVSVVVADLNGDGRPDLVVTDGGIIGGISVLLGNGNGTFQPHLDYTTLDFPAAVVVADFNGDGKPDLAFTMEHQTVAIGFGNGDGTFQAPTYYSAGTEFFGPHGLVVGDFNGDHKPDLVVGDGLSPFTVSVLLNDGKGGLQAARRFAIGSTPFGVALADLNGDGKLDLVTAVAVGTGSGVAILLGNGDGTFGAETDFSGGGIVVGDFNGDGKLDLTDGATVLLGKGDGTFGAPIGTGVPPGAAAVGDFNGDGKLDLAVSTGSGVAILLGKGDGTFQAPVNYFVGSVGALPSTIAVADFNGDGKPDLAVVANGGVDVLINRGDGTFLSPVFYSSGGLPAAVAVGDFNMDGHPDLAVANGGRTCTLNPLEGTYHCVDDHSLGILLGKGDGTFQTAITYQTGSEPISIAVADFNGDGKPDVAVTNPACIMPGLGSCGGSTISMLWGNGDGTFRKRLDYHVGPAPLALAAGDLNGDSKPDLVAVIGANATANLHPATNAVTVLLNTSSSPASVLSVTVSSTGPDIGGAVSSQPTQIMCGEECSAAYVPGTPVTLLAHPLPDLLYAFTGWSGDCSGTGACAVDLSADRSVVANFSPTTATFTLKITFAGNGTGAVGTSPPGCSSTCSASFPVGVNVSLGALANSGSTFGGWSGAGCTASMIACNVTMNSDVTVTATFNLSQLGQPDFSLQPVSANLTAQPGAQTTDVITIAPLNGAPFASAIQLSCVVTGPTSRVDCALSPTSVTPGASPATSTLTVSPQAGLLAAESRFSGPLYAAFLPVPLALIGLGLVSAKSKQRRRQFWLLCSLFLVFVALQAGCGGGPTSPPPPPPPAQTYTVTVTATSGAVTHTAQVIVTVP